MLESFLGLYILNGEKRGKKERVKSIKLKAKKESSDDETLTSRSDDEEYAMVVRNFKKFFRRKGKFVRQSREEKKLIRQRDDKIGKSDQKCFRCGDPNHLIDDYPKPSRNKDQKAFIGGSWSDSENDAKDKTNDETCLMAQSSNDVTLNSSYHSDDASSFDNDSMQIDATSLREMLNNQKLPSCKIGLGFDDSKASTSGTKNISFVGSSAEKETDESTIKVDESSLPGSVSCTYGEKGIEYVFSPLMSSRSDFVITRKKLIHNSIDESKKPSLKPSPKSGIDEIFFNQSKYIKEMLKKFGLEDSKRTKMPMSTKIKLTEDDEANFVGSSKYRGMIGSLLYLTASRPDIMFSVCLCARFQENPKTTHLEAVKCIFRYIRGTSHLGLWYPKGARIETVVYADPDHAGDYVDRKSTSGVCTFMGCCLTSWLVKKQTALAISTIEAEYVTPRQRRKHENATQ
uniref:Copia protein n=1 Tax=Tanacetum cinerariifolium TaxID=118510 RepID=A0A699I3F7_TANCI|nr:copia protein [Tanacetum cinerariifolium]